MTFRRMKCLLTHVFKVRYLVEAQIVGNFEIDRLDLCLFHRMSRGVCQEEEHCMLLVSKNHEKTVVRFMQK